ncbi:hypothetical protein EIN_407320 [Entamoeba invadens IP1]|uniref:Variant-specific surface protein n=1 Tax=Entamoeba invadens IP1 TaxID=370355 RepID=A0A0A1U1X7_ENTIV|nr:hypothetical protein EIN_407320 [Entamoeba invadens IP1]ELP85553.1 hypothetical protein EIN_407320 [Entamoeba invadens IP1]|eukprot:XP_004184899.1 hypothetical protein EIN_407320 [Entamoeba invadens IP1]
MGLFAVIVLVALGRSECTTVRQCDVCVEGSTTQCKTCNEGYFVTSTGICTEKAKYIGCETFGDTGCTKCKAGYVTMGNGVCEECKLFFTHCADCNETHCKTCDTGYKARDASESVKQIAGGVKQVCGAHLNSLVIAVLILIIMM